MLMMMMMITILHTSYLLTSNQFVLVIALDFSEAAL